MLIHEITEDNYLEERQKGQKELDIKFKIFDSLSKRKKGDKELIETFGKLFKDPTIWAYATLKDKQGKPLKTLPYQDEFINDVKRFVYVVASNQVGKTYGMCIKVLHHALHVPNASVLVISKSEQQAVMVLDEIKWMMNRARIDYKPVIGEIENRTELHIKGPQGSVSVIRCFPPTMSVLGFPATLIICDEINFWEKINELAPIEYYDQVLEPRTNMTKNWTHPFLTMGQIVFISNPNGKKGIGWRTFNSDDRFNCYRYCWLAYPENTMEEYNSARKRLPSYRFASIYAAEHVSADGGFITEDQYEEFTKADVPLIIPSGSVLYLGGDFAGEDVRSRNRDYNVLLGVVREGKVAKLVYAREWPANTNKKVIYAEIDRLGKNYTIGKFAYDKVGVGDKVKNDLIDRGILNEYQIEPLTYSLQNKSEVFINLQSYFEQGRIQGKEIVKLREQLMALEVIQKEGSPHLKIHHRTEGIRDDWPDSLANAVWAARFDSPPVSAQFVRYEQSAKQEKEDLSECKHYFLKHTPEGELECKSCGEEL